MNPEPSIPLNDDDVEESIQINPYHKKEINYREVYAEQLEFFKEAGFYDVEINVSALKRSNGNLDLAMNLLIEYYNM